MSQIFTSFPKRHAQKVLCCYSNTTAHIQIIKIANIQDFFFERVVFPGQRLLFEALPTAQLEIFTGDVMQAIVTDRILCQNLCIPQPESTVFSGLEALTSGCTSPRAEQIRSLERQMF
jgi:hypothetical protein